jgi:hypothetical protein
LHRIPLRTARELFASQAGENLRQHSFSGVHARKMPPIGVKSSQKSQIDHIRLDSWVADIPLDAKVSVPLNQTAVGAT